jgi:ABC-type molybdate transport system substrate-binding protein
MLMSSAVKTTMEELGPQFEKANNKVAITFGAASEFNTSIEKDAAFDVVILTPAALDALSRKAKSVPLDGPTSRERPSACWLAKADISITAAFKQALLEAKSIAWSRRAPAHCISRACSSGW